MNIMQIIRTTGLIISTVITLLPQVISLVKTVEKAMPEGGKGDQKLEMVREMLEKAHVVAGGTKEEIAKVWPIIDAAISGIVKMTKK